MFCQVLAGCWILVVAEISKFNYSPWKPSTFCSGLLRCVLYPHGSLFGKYLHIVVCTFVRLLLQIISKPFFISWKRMKTKDNTKVWNELEFLAFLLFVFYFFNTPRKWALFSFVIYSQIRFNISQRHRWFGCQVFLFLLR